MYMSNKITIIFIKAGFSVLKLLAFVLETDIKVKFITSVLGNTEEMTQFIWLESSSENVDIISFFCLMNSIQFSHDCNMDIISHNRKFHHESLKKCLLTCRGVQNFSHMRRKIAVNHRFSRCTMHIIM